jgi:hypothetical protein
MPLEYAPIRTSWDQEYWSWLFQIASEATRYPRPVYEAYDKAI